MACGHGMCMCMATLRGCAPCRFTSEKLSFTVEELPGNHLFFYDVPARAKWMESVIAKLPAAFH